MTEGCISTSPPLRLLWWDWVLRRCLPLWCDPDDDFTNFEFPCSAGWFDVKGGSNARLLCYSYL